MIRLLEVVLPPIVPMLLVFSIWRTVEEAPQVVLVVFALSCDLPHEKWTRS